MTQFFFSSRSGSVWSRELAASASDKPVLPGIMPVTTLGGIERMTTMGARVPQELWPVSSRPTDEAAQSAVRAEGIRAAVELCEQLSDV